MEFVLYGRAKEVFQMLNDIDLASRKGEPFIYYEGYRRSADDSLVIRAVISPADVGGMKAAAVSLSNLEPSESFRLYSHSDTFDWGNLGSGSSQLALALLLDATGDEKASLKYHQSFNLSFVSLWKSSWRVDSGQIKRWVALQKNLDYLAETIERRMNNGDRS